MKKKILLFASIVLAVCFTALAVYNLSGMKDISDLRKEMVSYFQDNIIPVLKTQRAKLDAELSETELQKVEDLKGQLKELCGADGHRQHIMKMFHGSGHMRMYKHKDGDGHKDCQWYKHDKSHKDYQGHKDCQGHKFHKKKGEHKANLTEEQIQEFKEKKDRMNAILEEADVIANDHSATIKQLLAEIKPDLEQWKNDIHEIVKKYIDIDEEKMDGFHKNFMKDHKNMKEGKCEGHEKIKKEKCEHHDGEHKCHMNHKGGHLGMLEKIFSPAGFILWDLDMFGQEENSADNAEDNSIKMKIYPNPSTGVNNIEYIVKEAGRVTISLLDSQGNVKEVIVDERKEPGTYTKEVVISDLKEGVYYYKVESNSKSSSKRFVINK